MFLALSLLFYTYTYRHNSGTDNCPTYDEIKQPTAVIYDTPVEKKAIELHTNTAYDRPVFKQEIINIDDNTAYGQIKM